MALFVGYEQVAARLRRRLPCGSVHIPLSHLASSSRPMSRCAMTMKRQHSAVQAALSDGSPRARHALVETKQQVRQIMSRYRDSCAIRKVPGAFVPAGGRPRYPGSR